MGAQRGNRNGWKHGGFSAPTLARHRAISAICRKIGFACDAMLSLKNADHDPDHHLPLLNALLPSQADWDMAATGPAPGQETATHGRNESLREQFRAANR